MRPRPVPVSGAVGQGLLFLFALISFGGLGFFVGWLLLGALLGFGVSFFIPNLDRKKAALAGLIGGGLGAIGYLIASPIAEWVGRAMGAAVLGFAIGLMVALVEVAFRRAFLEVRFGGGEQITVNFGPEPVLFRNHPRGPFRSAHDLYEGRMSRAFDLVRTGELGGDRLPF